MKKGDLFPLAEEIRYKYRYRFNNSPKMVEYTGEFRPPKEGEFYISGAIPEGYDVQQDLSTPFHIAKLVSVKVETKTVIKKIEPEYQLRFLTKEQYQEGINLYHLARCALAYSERPSGPSTYDRIVYAAKELAKKYGINQTAAYKDLSAAITGY